MKHDCEYLVIDGFQYCENRTLIHIFPELLESVDRTDDKKGR